jgi:hypothetical protein
MPYKNRAARTAATQRYNTRLKEAGLCRGCRNEYVTSPNVRCEKCQKLRAEKIRQRRETFLKELELAKRHADGVTHESAGVMFLAKERLIAAKSPEARRVMATAIKKLIRADQRIEDGLRKVSKKEKAWSSEEESTYLARKATRTEVLSFVVGVSGIESGVAA